MARQTRNVEEWAIHVIQGMYTNARSWVRVSGQCSEQFGVGVGVHKGSVFSPLHHGARSFICEFRIGLPWELLYVDDLVITTDNLEDCISQAEGMEVSTGEESSVSQNEEDQDHVFWTGS